MSNREVSCSICGEVHIRTVKQVNQAIKKKGQWACVRCMAGHNRLDLVGRAYGRLKVVSFAGSVNQRSTWLCECTCGASIVASGNCLQTGRTKSCGCLKRSLDGTNTLTHGASKTREYRIWQAMKNRCYNPRVTSYPNYGGRGVRVCARWLNDFEAFYADMGPCPQGFSIDRINNDGDYEPGNCRWASRREQARNQRRNRVIEFQGKSQCLSAWANELGMDQSSLRERLERWPLDRALTYPKLGGRA